MTHDRIRPLPPRTLPIVSTCTLHFFFFFNNNNWKSVSRNLSFPQRGCSRQNKNKTKQPEVITETITITTTTITTTITTKTTTTSITATTTTTAKDDNHHHHLNCWALLLLYIVQPQTHDDIPKKGGSRLPSSKLDNQNIIYSTKPRNPIPTNNPKHVLDLLQVLSRQHFSKFYLHMR